MPDPDVVKQLRAAMEALREESGVGWLDTVAEQVVAIGGGDAADLLQLALDRAIVDENDQKDLNRSAGEGLN